MESFLGEVHFEDLPGSGRVRCVETGHEMLAADKLWYGSSKKCRRALFDLCLRQRKPPLNVFEQSPTFKDKIICKLTGDLLNKSEEALWKHMNGKKFQRKLAQKEAEKVETQQRAECAMDVTLQVDERPEEGQTELCSSQKGDDETMNLEEPKFWVPPQDDMDSEGCKDGLVHCVQQSPGNDFGGDQPDFSIRVKRESSKHLGKSSMPSRKKRKL